MTGYEALRTGAGLIELAGRGVIRVSGEDRVRLLHAMSTNHVQGLAVGESCYAFFLNPQGRILADANILCQEDYLLLDTEADAAQKLFQHLDKFIIADDVTLEDLAGTMTVLALEGPEAEAVLKASGVNTLMARISITGAEGFRLYTDSPEVRAKLLENGAILVSDEEARTVRIENAVPRYGEDFGEDQIAQETRLMHALHFSKGCYLGQEIVERVRSRGHVNKVLAHLEMDPKEPPPAGTKIMAGDKEIGSITSSVYSPNAGRALAFGYLRTENSAPGTALMVGESQAKVSSAFPRS
jgi:aminomethyltransferase